MYHIYKIYSRVFDAGQAFAFVLEIDFTITINSAVTLLK